MLSGRATDSHSWQKAEGACWGHRAGEGPKGRHSCNGEGEGKATKATEKRVQLAKKAQLVAEKNVTEVEVNLGSAELKLAEVESLNLSQADELADLKTALETYEGKWYNEGFANAENSVELVVHQARLHGFGERWLMALQAMGVAENSPQRNPEQIPYPAPHPPVQSQAGTVDEEDTPIMRELVCAIDRHL